MANTPRPTLQVVSFEADQAAQVLPDPGVVVLPIVAVHGAQVPWGKVISDGVPVLPARRLPSMLFELSANVGPERVAGSPTRPGSGSTPPPNLQRLQEFGLSE
jgi:hypothetical protein